MKVNIRDLFDDLNPEEYRDIEIKNISIGTPSLESVKRQVFEDINKETNLENTKSKKKWKLKETFRGAWVATIIIFAIGTTVFAFNKPDFFKWIFGKDAEIAKENIQDIVATVSNKDIIFTLESILSDGNQNYFVISLEKKSGEEIKDNIIPIINTVGMTKRGTISIKGSQRIEGPNDSKSKKYYLFEVNTNANLIGKNGELVLAGLRNRNSGEDEEIFKKELKVSFNIGDNNANNIKTIVIENPQIINYRYYVTEIKLSNLGINLKGEEIGDLREVPIPRPKVDLKYKDGNVRNISQYKTPENPDIDFPNASHAYHRDPDKKEFTNTFTFGEIVDIDDLEAIIIYGKEYKISK